MTDVCEKDIIHSTQHIKEILQRTIVWEYNINFYVYKVPEYELVAEDATPLSVDEVDFSRL